MCLDSGAEVIKAT